MARNDAGRRCVPSTAGMSALHPAHHQVGSVVRVRPLGIGMMLAVPVRDRDHRQRIALLEPAVENRAELPRERAERRAGIPVQQIAAGRVTPAGTTSKIPMARLKPSR